MQAPELVANVQDGKIMQGDHLVLEDVHFSLARAEFCYIIGKTGSGKSSFLKTLYGALPIRGGYAEVAGQDLSKLDRKNMPSFRRKLGMIFQEFFLFENWTVEENMKFILEATDWKDEQLIHKRIEEVVKQINLSSKLHTTVSKLSGGEKQRVAIGRSILNKPIILIADEPTGNLDPETSDDILFLLRNLAVTNNTAILVATHDHRLMKKLPGRMYTCKNGGLHE